MSIEYTGDNADLERVRKRYFTSANGRAATPEDRQAMNNINDLVVALGYVIDAQVPAGRNRSLAETALEEVQMRAIRAIFAP